MSSSQLLPRMKRELEILEHDSPPGVVCYPVDDSLLHFCAQIKGPKDTPYEDGLFKVDVRIPSRYPMEPPKMQFITPIYHPNVDDAGRICLDLLKMPPKGSWKPSLNISTTLTSLSVLMADPNPDDPLLIEIASEFKENKSLFLQKARHATLKHAIDNEKALNPEVMAQESEQALSSTTESKMFVLSSSSGIVQESEQVSLSNSASNASVSYSLPDIQQKFETQSLQGKFFPQEASRDVISEKLIKTEESLLIIPQKKEKKKILSLSKINSKIEKRVPLEQISNRSTSVPTILTSTKTTACLNSSKSSQEENVIIQIEKRKPLGDITKSSINVPSLNNREITNQIQITDKNLSALNKAERKRKLLRKNPNDALRNKRVK